MTCRSMQQLTVFKHTLAQHFPRKQLQNCYLACQQRPLPLSWGIAKLVQQAQVDGCTDAILLVNAAYIAAALLSEALV